MAGVALKQLMVRVIPAVRAQPQAALAVVPDLEATNVLCKPFTESAAAAALLSNLLGTARSH